MIKARLAIEKPSESLDAWVRRHAHLINTSPQVMETNYNRENNTETNLNTLQEENQALGLAPDHEAAAVLGSVSLQPKDANKKMLLLLDHIINSPGDVHYLVKFSDGSQNWTKGCHMHENWKLADEYRISLKEKEGQSKLNKSTKPKKASPDGKSKKAISVEQPVPNIGHQHSHLPDDDDDFQLPLPKHSISHKPPVSPDKVLPLQASPANHWENNNTPTAPSKESELPQPMDVDAVPEQTTPKKRSFWMIKDGKRVDEKEQVQKKPRISLSLSNKN